MSNIDNNDYKDEKIYQDGFVDIRNLVDNLNSYNELEDPMNNGFMDADLKKFIQYVKKRIYMTAKYSNEFLQEKSLDDVRNKISMKLSSDTIDEMDVRVLEDLLNDIDYLFEDELHKAKK